MKIWRFFTFAISLTMWCLIILSQLGLWKALSLNKLLCRLQRDRFWPEAKRIVFLACFCLLVQSLWWWCCWCLGNPKQQHWGGRTILRTENQEAEEDVKQWHFKTVCQFCHSAGTSVSIEQLFTTAKFILTDTRKSTSPAVFETIILLKVNQTEWDVYSVGNAMGRTTGVSFSGRDGGGGDTPGCDDGGAVDDNDLFYDSM